MIEADIVAALEATFGDRVYPLTAPASVARPFCIWQNVGGQPVSTFCGGSRTRNARIQFMVFSDRAMEAIQKMRDLGDIVTAAPFLGISQGELITRYDDITRTYSAMQDFSFWFTD